jgi:hypothetical protein
MHAQEAHAPRWIARAVLANLATLLSVVGCALMPSVGHADWIPTPGAIYIVDDEYTKNENEGSFSVKIRRDGGAVEGDCVEYVIEPHPSYSGHDAATEGTDYQFPSGYSTSGWVCWGDLDSNDKVLSIPIVNDSVDEHDEYFRVRLVGVDPESQAQIGSMYGEATLKIVDNDPIPNVLIYPLPTTSVVEADGDTIDISFRWLNNDTALDDPWLRFEVTGSATGSGVDYYFDTEGFEDADDFLKIKFTEVGEYVTRTLHIVPDMINEPTETITISIVENENCNILAYTERTIEIQDSPVYPEVMQETLLWLRTDTGISASGNEVNAWADANNNGISAVAADHKPKLVQGLFGDLPGVNFSTIVGETPRNRRLGLPAKLFEDPIAQDGSPISEGEMIVVMHGTDIQGATDSRMWSFFNTDNRESIVRRFTMGSVQYGTERRVVVSEQFGRGPSADAAVPLRSWDEPGWRAPFIYGIAASENSWEARRNGHVVWREEGDFENLFWYDTVTDPDEIRHYIGGGNSSGTASQRFDGAIGELILFPRILTHEERWRVHAYLIRRMGLEQDPPPLPDSGRAIRLHESAAYVEWQQDLADTPIYFELQRREQGGSFVTLFGDVPDDKAMNVQSFLDLNLAPSTTYEYRVRAYNAWGATSWTEPFEIVTHPVLDYLETEPVDLASAVLWLAADHGTGVGLMEQWRTSSTSKLFAAPHATGSSAITNLYRSIPRLTEKRLSNRPAISFEWEVGHNKTLAVSSLLANSTIAEDQMEIFVVAEAPGPPKSWATTNHRNVLLQMPMLNNSTPHLMSFPDNSGQFSVAWDPASPIRESFPGHATSHY